MAKYKTGAIVTNISGSNGGTTFVNNPYYPFMRNKVIPVNTWSEAKQLSNHNQTTVSRLSEKLTWEQVLAWREFAKLFKKINKAGQEVPWRPLDLFRSINRTLVEIKEPFILDPPKKIYPPQFKFFKVEITASGKIDDIRIFFKPAIPKNVKVMVFASPQIKFGMNSTKKHFYRKIAVIDSTFTSGSSLLDLYMFAYPYSALRTAKIAFRFIPVSVISGLRSSPIEFIQSSV